MKIPKKYFVLFVILFILNFKENVLCLDTLQTVEVTLTGLTGTYLPAFSKGFLNEYGTVLGGQKEDFMHNFSYSLMLGVQWKEHYRLSLKTDYIYAHLQESFIKETFDSSNVWRSFNESISVKTVPVILNYDWYYFFEKYKSYLSGGIGLVYSEINWSEYVDSPVKFDKRVGGNLFNEITFYPALSLTTGVQLDFDEKSIPKFIRGITINTEFLYIFRKTDIFAKLREQMVPSVKELEGAKFVLPFLVGLNFGLVLNIESKKN